VHREVLWKIEKILKYFHTLAFRAMIGHVKINYGPKNQDCTPFTSEVLLKFSLIIVSASGGIVENKKKF